MLTAAIPATPSRRRFGRWYAGALVGYPALWIGSSLALGRVTGTSDVSYERILDPVPRALLWRAALPQALAGGLSLVWAGHAPRPMTVRDIVVQPGRRRGWLWVPAGLTCAVAFVLVAEGYRTERTGADRAAPSAEQRRPPLPAVRDQAALLATTLVIGVCEETMYRGVIQRAALDEGFDETAVGVLSAVAFGLLHLPNALLGEPLRGAIRQTGVTAVIGLGEHSLFRQSGHLAVPALVHGVWDFGAGMAGRRSEPAVE